MATVLDDFGRGVAGYLASCVFPAVVNGLAAKGVAVSVDDLLAMTNCPVVRQAPLPGPAYPSMAFGGGVVPSVSSAAKARSSTVTTNPESGKTCAYKFKRGTNKDQFCGKATAPGSIYCAPCLKTRFKNGTPPSGGAIPVVPGVAPGVGSLGQMNGFGAMVPNGPTFTAPAANSGPGNLQVKAYGPDHFETLVHGFIVKEVAPGTVLVVKRLQTDRALPAVPLNLADVALAESIGLSVPDEVKAAAASASASASVSASNGSAPNPWALAPPVPAVPVLQAPAPAIPAVPVPQVPAPAIHAIPALPVLPAPVPVQVPAAVLPPVIPQVNHVAHHYVPAVAITMPATVPPTA